jgi:CheY-like chemotaxis protein
MHQMILIVDDSYSCCEAVAGMLRRMGHRVSCAAGYRQAIQIIEQSSPDLMLLDLALPDGSGIDLLHQLRHDLKQDFPVIVFTGSADVQPLVSDGLGVTDCLVKSLASSSHIRAAVDQALHRQPKPNRFAMAG